MKEKIQHLVELGKQLKASTEFNDKVENAELRNPWFAPSFVRYAADAIINEMLNEAKLNEWLNRYNTEMPSLKEMASLLGPDRVSYRRQGPCRNCIDSGPS